MKFIKKIIAFLNRLNHGFGSTESKTESKLYKMKFEINQVNYHFILNQTEYLYSIFVISTWIKLVDISTWLFTYECKGYEWMKGILSQWTDFAFPNDLGWLFRQLLRCDFDQLKMLPFQEKKLNLMSAFGCEEHMDLLVYYSMWIKSTHYLY